MDRYSQFLVVFIKYYLPVVVWVLIIFSFSSNPAEPVSEIHWQDFIFKKTLHIIEYAILTVLLFRAFKKSEVKNKKAYWYSFLVASLYGVTDELHQSYTPGREPTVRDIFIDSIGSGVTIYLLYKVLPNSPNILKNLAKKLEIYK